MDVVEPLFFDLNQSTKEVVLLRLPGPTTYHLPLNNVKEQVKAKEAMFCFLLESEEVSQFVDLA